MFIHLGFQNYLNRIHYTKWQKDLWKDKTVKEISEASMEYKRTDSI